MKRVEFLFVRMSENNKLEIDWQKLKVICLPCEILEQVIIENKTIYFIKIWWSTCSEDEAVYMESGLNSMFAHVRLKITDVIRHINQSSDILCTALTKQTTGARMDNTLKYDNPDSEIHLLCTAIQK